MKVKISHVHSISDAFGVTQEREDVLRNVAVEAAKTLMLSEPGTEDSQYTRFLAKIVEPCENIEEVVFIVYMATQLINTAQNDSPTTQLLEVMKMARKMRLDK